MQQAERGSAPTMETARYAEVFSVCRKSRSNGCAIGFSSMFGGFRVHGVTICG